MTHTNQPTGRKYIRVVILLALVCSLIAAACASDAARRQRIVPKYILLFPLDAPSGEIVENSNDTPIPESFGTEIMGELRNTLSRTQGFRPLLFSDRLAPITRARQDNTLKLEEVQPPYSEDDGKALAIARLLLTDLYMVGTIEDHKVDPVANEAVVTLSVRLLDGRNGRQLKSFVVTGRANQSNVEYLNLDLDVLAGLDAVGALRDQMLEKPTAEK